MHLCPLLELMTVNSLFDEDRLSDSESEGVWLDDEAASTWQVAHFQLRVAAFLKGASNLASNDTAIIIVIITIII